MNKRTLFSICLSMTVLTAMGCGGGESAEPCKATQGADGAVALNCGDGGRATLEPGADGKNSLITSAPAAEADCPAGGTTFQFGVDADGSGALEEAEITQRVNVCQGASGADGADGTSGADGADGAVGADGADGQTALVNVSPEPAGLNCEAGGQKLEFGVDADGDGALGAAEIQNTRFICDGVSGLSSLIEITDEPVGSVDCPNGGQRISHGLDADRSGALDAAEIAGSRLVCNGVNGLDGLDGEDGADGFTTLSLVSPEPAGANCAAGGQKLESGLDSDYSGSLEAGEIALVRYICNGAAGAAGANGLNTLVVTTAEAVGANCTTGGLRLTSGLDANRNNTLDAAEVTSTRYVCNGAAGAAGAAGKNALVNVTAEAAGANCVAGGQKIEFGQDDNGNNTLEAGEIDGTRYVCNGSTDPYYVGRGIQQNITLAAVEARGWRRCHTDLYNATNSLTTILANCQGTYMMLACRQTNSATLTLAAADLRSTVTTDVGTGSTAHTPGTGGVNWYYSNAYSWGFYPSTESLNRASCDYLGTRPEQRMCWHTGGNSLTSGYRCGDNDLNSSTAYERLILVH